MSQTVGSIKGHELWIRCPECGDTQRNLNKGHLSVNLIKGVFYCVRCTYSGVLSPKQVLDLAARYDMGSIAETIRPEAPEVDEEAGSPRFSALKRWNYVDPDWQTWDVFEIRDPKHNEATGQYFRLGSSSLIFGEIGLGWVGSQPLISSQSSPLRLVEGPYDVLGPQDVCCYGFLRTQALKLLVGHYVLLCPDGDVWEDDLLREKMGKVMKWCFSSPKSPWIVGLEMIPDGLDPDECHPSDRLLVPRNDLLRKMITRRELHYGGLS